MQSLLAMNPSHEQLEQLEHVYLNSIQHVLTCFIADKAFSVLFVLKLVLYNVHMKP